MVPGMSGRRGACALPPAAGATATAPASASLPGMAESLAKATPNRPSSATSPCAPVRSVALTFQSHPEQRIIEQFQLFWGIFIFSIPLNLSTN